MEKIRGWLLRNTHIRELYKSISQHKSICWIKKQLKKNNYGMLVCWLLGAFVIYFLIELMQRGNIQETWQFIYSNSDIYIINMGIILIITSVSYLFRKKYFVYSIISIILLLIGFTNKILLNMKGEALTYYDVFLIKEGIEVANKYIGVKEIVLYGIGILIGLILLGFIMVLMWKKDTHKKKLSNSIAWLLIFITVVITPIKIYFSRKNGTTADMFWDLVSNYKANGFSYSFLSTVEKSKRSEPKNYSKKSIEDIKDTIEDNKIENNKSRVDANVIMIQLESFFDPLKIEGVTYDIDPISTFREISNKYTSGEANVCTFGGGTVKSEFEFLTGMTMKNFPVGEIPYNTVLRNTTVESMPRILKKYGLTSHVVHNYESTFYGRDEVYKNIGFKTFTPIESMTGYDTTPIGWPKDDVLLKYIAEAMDSTEGNDFVYVVTVQDHGGYDYGEEFKSKVTANAEDISDWDKKQLEYYCNQIYETDQFIKSLIEYLEDRGEPTIVSLVSDHLPSLNVITGDNANYIDKYKVNYAIWDNMGLEKEDEDIESYQLSTKILNALNITSGIIPSVHNTFKNENDYSKKLALVQYDMLFGKKYCMGNEELKRIDTKIGVKNICVDKAYMKNKELIVKGENFTEFSKVYVNKKLYDTQFINENEVRVKNFDGDVNKVTVNQVARQAGRNSKVLAGC
uniref:LTA synthase family protein n=1 Tax=uncultured Clostridium sp. TaxID=59620 RepID=UPI0025D51F2F